MNLEEENNLALVETTSCEVGGRTSNDQAVADTDFASALIAGLSGRSKSIPCRFFYDAEGSRLFERITELPEYYPTRTEIGILRAHATEIASLAPRGAVLVEFGSGSSTKTEILLEAAPHLRAYVPIDISPTALEEARTRIEARFPNLSVSPLVGDFSHPLRLPRDLTRGPLVGFFPGSTIGNLTQKNAVALLASMRAILGDGSTLIIGADLRKHVRRLIAAYDDAEGVTAAFNLNILRRANRELGADFDLYAFGHLATYDVRHGRIDMHLVSRFDQTVTVLGRRFRFFEGERIHTEHSHKYDIDGFHTLVQQAGWLPGAVWTDPDRLFSVHVLAAR
jgi:dimethylhistidine N-methyltransferase